MLASEAKGQRFESSRARHLQPNSLMLMQQRLHIATRKSPLALWQAHHVRDLLHQHHPALSVELLPLSTAGDRWLQSPLVELGGKGLFVKELEDTMLQGRAQLAVHSLKDMPVALPEGFSFCVIGQREEARDALLSTSGKTLATLAQGAKVGTASLRRQCQLLHARPDLDIQPIRGNVGTRLKKLDDGQYDALIMATAGLKRLGLAERITEWLSVDQCLPAVGQGALAIEYLTEDTETAALLAPLINPTLTQCTGAERAMSTSLGGGCHVPMAAHATIEEEILFMQGLVGEPNGKRILRAHVEGPAEDYLLLGQQLADALCAQGAETILRALD